ncbi:MAG: alpha-galactosidase [Planctomycetota bacterium]|nr:alpha-galactosidase [Planctomycetota bacterium]
MTTCSVRAAGLVTPDEMARKDSWVKAALEPAAPAAPAPGLTVLANNDSVNKNARGNKPLTIVDKEYTHGLFCHAVSKVVVQLPSPGKTFTAIAGVDSNEQTKPGKASVVFSVTVAGKEAFKSPVMREGMAGVPVSVDLADATSFTLDIGDAGDGISCDQSDWADAKVVLADGKELWLADLPFVEPGAKGGLPFSFMYGGRSSVELLPSWPRKEDSKKLDDSRTERTLVWTDPATGLAVRCVTVEYRDFPTLEWTLYFRNTGAQVTPILADILALDGSFSVARPARSDAAITLHHHAGSQATPDDYRPYQTQLKPKASLRLGTSGGRGSDGVWPYFNLDWGTEGVIAVVGWPGQWAATFARDSGAGLHIHAGQEKTHFKLLPGEEVRSPLIALQFWQGNAEAGTATLETGTAGWIKAQNVWRRWMLAYNVPRLAGKLPPFLLPASSANQLSEMQNANEQNQKEFIDGYIQNGVQISFWWMDAGWYTFKDGWWNVGTWEVDKKRFPNGLRAVSDHAHKNGVKTLLWFEPERVTPGTWLYENHKEWLLGKDGQQKLLDLGNPEARQWVIEHVDKTMAEQGIDIYRQDFNFPPLGYWRANDAPDRQGITEIKHVTGYLAFWDELRRRHPDLLIDTCASGGRRNDLETLRRSVPLHKSDMEYPNLTSKQTQLYGLAFWSPFFGAPVYPAERVDVYGFRTGMAPMTGTGYDTRRKDLDYALMRKLVAEWREIAPNFYGDYYPLTSWSYEPDVWIAWQFDRPEEGQGMVQAFRRPQSLYETARLKLRGLGPAARYALRNFDVPGETEVSGKELMEKGLAVSIPDQPGAVIITYKRAK